MLYCFGYLSGEVPIFRDLGGLRRAGCVISGGNVRRGTWNACALRDQLTFFVGDATPDVGRALVFRQFVWLACGRVANVAVSRSGMSTVR